MKIRVIKESNGTHKGQTVFCPVNAFGDCPYCGKNNVCYICDPMADCDDFATIFESWDYWEEL